VVRCDRSRVVTPAPATRFEPGAAMKKTANPVEPLLSNPPASGELAALRAIVEATAQGTGDVFFQSLVRHLAGILNVRHAMVAGFAPRRGGQPRGGGRGARLAANTESALPDPPWEDAPRAHFSHPPAGAAGSSPADTALADMGIESYLGVPLTTPDQRNLGHLC